MIDQIAQRLQTYCVDKFPHRHNVIIRDLEDITIGWESEIYAFALEHGRASHRERQNLVLRLHSGEGAGEKSAREFYSIKRLREVGYPVPQVYLLERDPSLFGKPFIIMERIDGQMMWTQFDAADAKSKAASIRQFCTLFVRLHQTDWRLFMNEAEQPRLNDPYVFLDEWFGVAQKYLEQFPGSGFRAVVEWLKERRALMPYRKPSPTHNDFHPGNVLVQDDDSLVVIDWTGFQISDARFDLAWTLILAHAYMGAEWREIILREYEHFSAGSVDALDCFIVFACARRLFDITTSLLHGAEKMGMRANAVASMKKNKAAHERVYRLLMERTGLRVKEVDEMLLSLYS